MARTITLKHYLSYGSRDFFGMGTTALTGAWLLFFYTNFCHLSAVEAASISPLRASSMPSPVH